MEHRPNFANSAPAIADVNGDGVPEIVVVGNVYNCGTDPYTDLYHMPFILKHGPHALERQRLRLDGDPRARRRAAAPRSQDYNVIENGVPERRAWPTSTATGARRSSIPSYDGRLHAYWLDKTEHGSWPYDGARGGRGRRVPLRGRAGGGRPEQRRPGRGALHVVAQERRRPASGSSTSSARWACSSTASTSRAVRRRLERRPGRARPWPTSTPTPTWRSWWAPCPAAPWPTTCPGRPSARILWGTGPREPEAHGHRAGRAAPGQRGRREPGRGDRRHGNAVFTVTLNAAPAPGVDRELRHRERERHRPRGLHGDHGGRARSPAGVHHPDGQRAHRDGRRWRS